MKELINAIARKHQKSGIKLLPPATIAQICKFEEVCGFPLPDDFKEFYLVCNGFECTEDIFNMTPLEEVISAGYLKGHWFYFSEYMILSDMWGLRYVSPERYEIFNGSYPDLVLTSSLYDFLSHYLQGDVFESEGLYEWQEKIKNN